MPDANSANKASKVGDAGDVARKPALNWRNLRDRLVGGKSWRHRFDVHLSPAAQPRQTGELQAGVAEVDITPFPGVPKGGYSAMSQTAVGFRGRLKARVFYISPADGDSFCLLQADLHAGSALIRNLVTEQVAPHTDINPGNLMLTCTHTHSGPGQLLESDFYNNFASHKPGLDWELLQQISRKISDAVIRAYQTRRPAKIASGVTRIMGLTRNRSIVPYLNNPDASGNRHDPQLKYQAVNPNLHMLRIDLQDDDGHFHPAGAFSNFSIHGTCIPASSDVFSADSWAYVSGELERWIEQQYAPPWKPVHGPSQGTHGDIAPDVAHKEIGFPEARRIGCAIAEKAAELFRELDGKLKQDVPVCSGLRLVDFYREPTINGITIASHPMVGTALTAGAYEHSTPVLYHMPFFKHGMGSARLFSTDPEQGHKRKLAGNLQKLVLPRNEFPHRILFQTVQLGSLVLVGVPFEVTVKAGEEIADAVRDALPATADPQTQICVASLTNGYTGYTTTAEEYEKQYYEGGHTLYGPNSNRFIAEHCRRLMADTVADNGVSDLPPVWHYSMLCRRYQEEVTDSQPSQQPKWLGSPVFENDPVEPYWKVQVCWAAPWQLPWEHCLAELQMQSDAGDWQAVCDDQGYDLEVRYRQGIYELRWYPQQQTAGIYRFALAHSDYSVQFAVYR